MTGHPDPTVELTKLIKDGASQARIDAVLKQISADQRAEILRRAKEAVAAGEEHEGATDTGMSDRTGPAAGYDTEPVKVKDKGGVS